MRVRLWLLAAAISAVSGSIGLSACSSTVTPTGVVPVTGITIPAATLTGGIGCGTGAGQVYKYAAVVQDPAVGAVYDCFADAAFINLIPQSDGGGLYTLDVFLYDKATYDANASQINAAVGAANGAQTLALLPSSYSTTCTGSQIGNLQTQALCAPVSTGGPGFLRVATGSFALSDGGTLGCLTAFTSVVSGDVDAGVAADAGIPSALCPTTLTLGPFPALTQVSSPITIINGADRVGTTTCHGAITPHGSTSATCDPVLQ